MSKRYYDLSQFSAGELAIVLCYEQLLLAHGCQFEDIDSILIAFHCKHSSISYKLIDRTKEEWSSWTLIEEVVQALQKKLDERDEAAGKSIDNIIPARR